MSQFFDQASLVMVPSGYNKNGKVYSQKPLSADGQLAFTRTADTATRIGPDSLIQKVRTNLFLQSETFSNASWGKTNSTFSVDTLTANAGTDFKGIEQVEVTQGLQNIYFDVAYTNHAFLQIGFGTSASDLGFSNYDIQNKVLGVYTGIVNNSIQDFGTYVRISLSINTTGKTAVFLIFANSASDSRAPSYTGTGSFKLFRSQNQTGDIATDYIPTTTAAVSVGPVANLPRLDYLGSSCPKLLLEPQSTALNQYSEAFDNAYWLKNASTIVANHATSPDGYQNADLMYPTSAGVARYVLKFVGATSGLAYTTSVFAKASGKNWLGMANVDAGSTTAWFNLSTGTVGTVLSGTTATITDYGNGWYRCTVTRTAAATTGAIVLVVEDADNSDNITPNGTDGILLYGCNFTQSAYATSYIPTLGAAVTRGADVCNKTGISSLIGSEAGTMFINTAAAINDSTAGVISVSDGTLSNRCILFYGVGNISARLTVGGVNSIALLKTLVTTDYHKIAASWNGTTFNFYVDGVLVSSTANSSFSANTLTSIRFDAGSGANNFYGNAKEILIFPTALTTAQMAELTTI